MKFHKAIPVKSMAPRRLRQADEPWTTGSYRRPKLKIPPEEAVNHQTKWTKNNINCPSHTATRCIMYRSIILIIIILNTFSLNVWEACVWFCVTHREKYGTQWTLNGLGADQHTPFILLDNECRWQEKLTIGQPNAVLQEAWYSEEVYTVKSVYNDHLMGYFSAFWSSSRWPRAT